MPLRAFQRGTVLSAAILAGRFCIASDLFHRSIFSSTRIDFRAPIFSLSFMFLFLFLPTPASKIFSSTQKLYSSNALPLDARSANRREFTASFRRQQRLSFLHPRLYASIVLPRCAFSVAGDKHPRPATAVVSGRADSNTRSLCRATESCGTAQRRPRQ